MKTLPKIKNIQPLIPPFWANSGHLQTILSHLLPSEEIMDLSEKFIVELHDKEKIVSFYYQGTSETALVLFHGLSGDVNSDYMQRSQILAKKLGHHCFLVNHRGVHDGKDFAVKPYHSGRGEDASDVISAIRKKLPGKKIIAIGTSLSGSVLLNLVSGRRGNCLPDAVITVNAPLDLEKASKVLRNGLNRIYDLNFVRKLKKEVDEKFRMKVISKKYEISNFSTLYDLDQIYTAPASGFESREHYYQTCSTKNYLKDIKTPTILLTAKDDPFIDYNDYLTSELSSFCQLHIENVGGHVGYLTSPTGYKHQRWLDYFLMAAIQLV